MQLVIGLVCAIAIIISANGSVHAASAAICNEYAAEAASKAKGVQIFNCGYDTKNPRWSTDRDGHARWCRAMPQDVVAKEAVQRRAQINWCQTCRIYADEAAMAASENSKLNCGFTGPRWSAAASDHFAWCMSAGDNDNSVEPDAASVKEAAVARMKNTTWPETRSRFVDLAKCKAQ